MRKIGICLLICVLALSLAACGGRESYKVEFMVEGESYKIVSTDGTRIRFPSEPQKDGFEFVGWFFDDGKWERPFNSKTIGEVEFVKDTPLKVYAKFDKESGTGGETPQPIKYRVNFVTNGGSAVDTIDFADSGYIDFYPMSYRDGYVLEGWFKNAELTGASVQFPLSVTGNMTLYAKWTLGTGGLDCYIDGEYASVFYVGTATGDIVIPDTYKGVPIKKIEERAFQGSNITSVTFPAQLERVVRNSFAGCTKLTKLNFLQSTNVEIEYEAFADCTSITKIDFPKSGNLIIGERAFFGCTGLRKLDIASGIKEIGFKAFAGCTGLSEVSLSFVGSSRLGGSFGYMFGGDAQSVPDSIKTVNVYGGVISNRAFEDCKNIQTVVVSNGVNIGEGAFGGCINLNSVTLPTDLGGISSGLFQGCRALRTIDIPKSVQDIGHNAFEDCHNLNNVVLPSGIQAIGERAFAGCSSIRSIDLPATLKDIGNGAFNGCSQISSIVFPQTLIVIGAYAFADCYQLQTINIPNYVNMIGDSAFSNCTALREVKLPQNSYTMGDNAFLNCTALETVNFKEGLTAIGSNAFYNCYNLSVAILPNSLAELGRNVFQACKKLREVTLPQSLSVINGYAFSGCDSLETVNGGNALTTIKAFAFYGCKKLESFALSDSITSIGDEAFRDCVLYDAKLPKMLTSIGALSFYNCQALTTVDIAPSVNYIGHSSFSQCQSVETINFNAINADIESSIFSEVGNNTSGTQVNIGSEVQIIPNWAFSSYGSNIVKISFAEGGSCTAIGVAAFQGCSKLKNLEIPLGVKSIGDRAFSDCRELEYIHLPITVTSMGSNVLYGCNRVAAVAHADSKPAGWDASWNAGRPVYWGCESILVVENSMYVPSGESGATLIKYLGNAEIVNIPSAVTLGGKDCAVTAIGGSAFYGNQNLFEVNIPDAVTEIGSAAFLGCEQLQKADLPLGLVTIGENSFNQCLSLTNINIPKNVQTIGKNAFYGCKGVDTVYYNAANADDLDYINGAFSALGANGEGVLLTIGKDVQRIPSYIFFPDYAAYAAINITEIVFEEGSVCEEIASNAFNGSTSLTEVIFPISLKKIGNNAFENCLKLENLTFTENISEIGGYAFAYCNALSEIYIPNTVETIGECAFYSCQELIIYTQSAEKPEKWAENWCANEYGAAITPIYWGVSDNAILEIDGAKYIVFEDGAVLVKYYGTADKFIVPEYVAVSGRNIAVTEIGSRAFMNCSSLVSVSMGEGITAIGPRAFYGCDKLASIKLSDSLTVIEQSAFSYCSALTDLTIPKGVTKIGDSAFSYCLALASLTIPNSVETIENSAFYGCSNLEYIFIPKSVATMSSAFYGCDKINIYTEFIAMPSTWVSWNIGTDRFVYNCALSADGDYLAYVTKYAGNPAMQVSNPLRSGYVFDGWYENADFTGAQYMSLFTAPVCTLYAKWVAI